jgi:hypothetical protein
VAASTAAPGVVGYQAMTGDAGSGLRPAWRGSPKGARPEPGMAGRSSKWPRSASSRGHGSSTIGAYRRPIAHQFSGLVLSRRYADPRQDRRSRQRSKLLTQPRAQAEADQDVPAIIEDVRSLQEIRRDKCREGLMGEG